jgi:hypothetical protein
LLHLVEGIEECLLAGYFGVGLVLLVVDAFAVAVGG